MSAKMKAARGKPIVAKSGRFQAIQVGRGQDANDPKALKKESKSYRREFVRLSKQSDEYYSSLLLKPIRDKAVLSRGMKIKVTIRIRFPGKDREEGEPADEEGRERL